MLRCILLIVSLGLAAPLFAAEEEEQEGPWSGKVTLGYLATSGNTDTTNINSGFEVGYKPGKWAHLLTATAIGATENDVTTAEAYDAGWKSARSFASEDNYLFGALTWRNDRFSGYDTQFSQTVGYGRRLFNTERHRLNAEVGAGARQSELADGTDEDETVYTGALRYRWTIGDNAEFRQNLLAEVGAENTYLESVTELSAKLVGELALVASYTVKNNSEVPLGTENTDTYTALSLEYGF